MSASVSTMSLIPTVICMSISCHKDCIKAHILNEDEPFVAPDPLVQQQLSENHRRNEVLLVHRSDSQNHLNHNGIQDLRHTEISISRRKNITATMSSLHEIDPRLRDTATPTNTTYSQRPSSASLATPIAPNPIAPAPQQQQYPPIHDGSPHQSIYPHTPQSAGNEQDADGGDGTQEGGPNDPKRPRACEACRGLKVRCEPNPADPDGPCKRCNKANRNCVVTAPSRKRQKKTDSRVAELEKKIDALTASLKATKSDSPIGPGSETGQEDHMSIGRNNPYQQVTNGGYGAPYVPRPDATRMHSNEWAGYPKTEYDMRRPIAPPMVMAGQKRKQADSRDSMSDTRSIHSAPRRSVDTGRQQIGYGDAMLPQEKAPTTNEYADVIDRGVVSADMAAKMFDCYVERMTIHMPAVVFPAGTTAAEVRKNKPTLFLAILAAASGMNYPDQQKNLTKEVMSIYADRIICKGEKTLEVIQALQVSTLWYWPPEHFEELKFYQLIHIAAVMAIDIGMGKKSKNKNKSVGLWRDHPWRRTPFPDPESIESRRAWLACYFLCCNASMGLRRPNLIRWSSFMADCIDVLENSPEAAPSDKVICQWVRSQHIAEEVGTQFSMDDPVANISIADSKVQYALKGFERDLEKWTSGIPADVQSPTLRMTEHVVSLYMHEVAMHVDHNVDEFKPPFSEDSLRGNGQKPEPLTSSHVNALSVCLTSIDGIFDTFLKLDPETIRCLPVAHFVRVAYAVVVLIKMYFAAATPNSELGKVIDKDNMKVEQYLDGLVEIFRSAAADEKSRPASKFLMVLTMLKTWFHRQREGKLPPTTFPAEGSTMLSVATEPKNGTDAIAQNPNENSRPKNQQTQPGYAPANTPLQVLSELASANQASPCTPASAPLPATPTEWPQQHQQYPNYDPALMAQTGFGNMAMSNIDPSLGMDLRYTMGDGFEQAMGMTLGVGDFGNYFSDDSFFGSIMDSVGGGPGFDGF